MIVYLSGTQGIISDNSALYLMFLNAVIAHADPEAILKISKEVDKLRIVINPSEASFREDILENVLAMHKIFHIKPEFAKSTKIQKNLFFNISL